MPYIKEDRRAIIVDQFKGHSGGGSEPDEPATCFISAHEIENAGELNYAITMLVQHYLHETKGLRYQYLCEVEGVLGHVAKELYRRTAVPYEDEKIAENGDCFR